MRLVTPLGQPGTADTDGADVAAVAAVGVVSLAGSVSAAETAGRRI
jgi:hypothetical protein